ncbi:MAG: hypothetical protein QOF15_3912 [Mycobacterium sp.]|nr:hypothetical protein [Mycobacterium sp.]
MAIEDRRERERAVRRRLIMDTARTLAEAEGWDAVTTRRLSTEIEYSQPVLYKHFTGMEEIAEALAVEGFDELADVLHTARVDAEKAERALTPMAHAYLDFARDNPALYDAMFTRATSLRFATNDTPPPLLRAFTALRDAIAAIAADVDTDTFTEVFWAALHGIATLERGQRLRPGAAAERIKLLADLFLPAP